MNPYHLVIFGDNKLILERIYVLQNICDLHELYLNAEFKAVTKNLLLLFALYNFIFLVKTNDTIRNIWEVLFRTE